MLAGLIVNLKKRKGFTLIATGFCVVSLFGMLGLALDLGRVYITKNETQSFTDTAAIAAALALNPTSSDPPRSAVTGNTTNRWNMATAIFTTAGATTIATEFAKPLTTNNLRPDPSTWAINPATASNYTFVRVTASATLPLYVLPVLGISSSSLVRAYSVGGQVPLNNFTSGLFPFSPIQHASAIATNPPFGYVVGQWYTLRYPGGATFNNSDLCPGDQGDPAFLAVANQQASDERGFYQDPAASVAVTEIINSQMVNPVTYPGTITMSGGAMSTAANAINDRINMDTDQTSTSFEQYQANIVNGSRVGNGFRIIGVPVNEAPIVGGGSRAIVGFAGFFLSASSTSVYYNSGGGNPWCAEYYGTWVKDAPGSGAGTAGLAYVAVLVQ